MTFSKHALYDWNGWNQEIFQTINDIHGPTYDSAMVFLTRTADHNNFPYYMAALAIWAVIGFIIRKAAHKGGAQHVLVGWIAALIVIGVSYGADGYAVKHIKEDFAYPRPLIIDEHVHALDHPKDNDDAYHSFPSGHASFATVMVIGAWPALSLTGGLVGLLWVAAVCWSRIAVGMHFPADVLTGFLLALIIVLIMRFIIYNVLRKVFKIKC